MLKTLNSLNISTKLPIVIALAAILVGLGTGVSGYMISSNTVDEMSHEKLHTLAVARDHEVERALYNIEKELVLFSHDPAIFEGLEDFSNDFAEMGIGARTALQNAYIADNPNPTGEKHLLDRAPGLEHYHKTHAHFHPFFRDMVKVKGYYDVFLFDTKGNLVYSMYKELDYAENFATNGGPYADSGLGQVFRDAMGHENGHISFVDFAPYAPSAGAPASFMATKINSEDGRELGVMAIQMPVGLINELLADRTGLGETGETILVGEDGLLRVTSHFIEGDNILETSFDKSVIDHAIAEGEYSDSISTYRGMQMEVYAVPFVFEGVNWVVVAVQGTDELNAPIMLLRNLMLAIGAGLTIAIVAVGYFFSRSITKPVGDLTNSMGRLADGDLEIEIPGRDRNDELGKMSAAVEVFKQNGIERARLANESEAEQAQRAKRQENIERMIGSFRETVSAALESVGTNSVQMNANADSLSNIADSTSNQAEDAVNASKTAAENVQAVAAAAEELAASIEEISQQVSRTNTIVNEATSAANVTNDKVAGLAEAARKIGDVISLIQDIAEQTNLLALNTSIEAARAGEAGKGFAVVASEVKSLANQTATATEEISAQIANIQNSTEDAVGAIEDIAKTMAEVNTYTASIASAVEEQGSATAEISQSVTHAAQGTEQVVASLATVTSSVGETRTSASEVQTASKDVRSQADMLKNTVDKFLNEVNAA